MFVNSGLRPKFGKHPRPLNLSPPSPSSRNSQSKTDHANGHSVTWPGVKKGLCNSIEGRIGRPQTHLPPWAAQEILNPDGIERKTLGVAVSLPLPFPPEQASLPHYPQGVGTEAGTLVSHFHTDADPTSTH